MSVQLISKGSAIARKTEKDVIRGVRIYFLLGGIEGLRAPHWIESWQKGAGRSIELF